MTAMGLMILLIKKLLAPTGTVTKRLTRSAAMRVVRFAPIVAKN